MSMKQCKKYFKGLVYLILILMVGYTFIEPIYTPTALLSTTRIHLLPKIVAHKAVISGNYIGNTREAILEAKNSLVEGIEIDVRLSKDKIPFLYHPEQLETLTNCKGVPEDYLWVELKHCKYSKQTTNKDSHLLSLDEVLDLVDNDKFIFLDIKERGVFNKEFASIIADAINKKQLNDSVIVESFNPIFLTYLRLISRDILIMLDFTQDGKASAEEAQDQYDKIPWLLKQPFMQKQFRRIVRPDILGPRWNLPTDELKRLYKHGYPIIAWTVDDVSTAKELFYAGVIGLQSNRPLHLRESLKSILYPQVFDAGNESSRPYKVVNVNSEEDVVGALKLAKKLNLKISIAGSQHTMGGQTLLNNSIHLNMLTYNKVIYEEKTKRVKIQSGATWKKVQELLNEVGRSVKIMQSDNIFSLGGSIGANVHGWQVNSPPLGSTIHAMKIIDANGHIIEITKSTHEELFKSIIGGYGQFAIILEVELDTTPNNRLKFGYKYFPMENYADEYYNNITLNPRVELAYGRISLSSNDLLSEAGLFWYEKVEDSERPDLQPEKLIAIKRAIFRLSEYLDWGKKLRWEAEKSYAYLNQGSIFSRNTAMNADIHILWPVRNGYIDILQEYFIPKNNINQFITALKELVKKHQINLLNVTVREVLKDDSSNLPYAKDDVFAFVMLFAQEKNGGGEDDMKMFSRNLIDKVLEINGTFYLPYKTNYTFEQFKKSYPMYRKWWDLKMKYDPSEIFQSKFLEHLKKAIID